MAHYQQEKFVEEVKSNFPEFFTRTRVLEVGSWIVNGTLRTNFVSCDYVGVDISKGPGVDIAVPGQDLALPSDSFDIVISCNCFEHNAFWLETFINMIRMLKPGGLFVFSCAGIGHQEHGTRRKFSSCSLTSLDEETDYYGNLSRYDFERRMTLRNHFSRHVFIDNRYSKDLYFIGFKRGVPLDGTIEHKLASLQRAVKKITVAPGQTLTVGRRMRVNGRWWTEWYLARLLGEKKFHDLKYFSKNTERRYRHRIREMLGRSKPSSDDAGSA